MTRALYAATLLFTLFIAIACKPSAPSESAAPKRATIRAATGGTIEVLPAAGQLPFCVLFTVSERHVVRLLTMNEAGVAVPCEAGAPIGGVTYRLPATDGAAKVLVVFADRAVEAKGIAAQIREVTDKGGTPTAMDLRAPGAVTLEILPAPAQN
jgi:hypothetical protein